MKTSKGPKRIWLRYGFYPFDKHSFFGGSSSSLLLHSSHGTGLIDGSWGHLNMLFRGDSDHERWNVNHLLTNSDVSLSDQNSGMMDGVSEFLLSDEGLESSFHELVEGKTENIIKLSFVLLEETKSDHSSKEGITFEKSSWISLVQSHEASSSLSDFGEGELDSPCFSLASKTVLADNSELLDKSVFIERFPWSLRSFSIICVFLWHFSM
jgi:hypothetical protein